MLTESTYKGKLKLTNQKIALVYGGFIAYFLLHTAMEEYEIVNSSLPYSLLVAFIVLLVNLIISEWKSSVLFCSNTLIVKRKFLFGIIAITYTFKLEEEFFDVLKDTSKRNIREREIPSLNERVNANIIFAKN
ncbi:hypothetical protein QA612_06615 [Evansella sp. AB-P1]|uniref:hypothetical protein n=1 Tax=Evansella sp. AB-P1 TaxID=3037653 RepID=UPI00241CC6C1|nr:hypothetical protein [Evansella sp. AB-P1]MDG5787159.1 hypothetical protein [Evansella sp. AB-P1]